MHLDQICVPIKDEVARLNDVMRARTESNIPLVTEVAHYIIENGGKRLRPILCLLACKLVGNCVQKRFY